MRISSIQFDISNVFNTRSNKFKIQLTHIHYDIQKLRYTEALLSNKIIAECNSLPNDVVSVDSTGLLKIVWISSDTFSILNLIGMST